MKTCILSSAGFPDSPVNHPQSRLRQTLYRSGAKLPMTSALWKKVLHLGPVQA